MNYEGVCFYFSIFLAGGDACAPGNYEGGGNMEPAKDN